MSKGKRRKVPSQQRFAFCSPVWRGPGTPAARLPGAAWMPLKSEKYDKLHLVTIYLAILLRGSLTGTPCDGAGDARWLYEVNLHAHEDADTRISQLLYVCSYMWNYMTLCFNRTGTGQCSPASCPSTPSPPEPTRVGELQFPPGPPREYCDAVDGVIVRFVLLLLDGRSGAVFEMCSACCGCNECRNCPA